MNHPVWAAVVAVTLLLPVGASAQSVPNRWSEPCVPEAMNSGGFLIAIDSTTLFAAPGGWSRSCFFIDPARNWEVTPAPSCPAQIVPGSSAAYRASTQSIFVNVAVQDGLYELDMSAGRPGSWIWHSELRNPVPSPVSITSDGERIYSLGRSTSFLTEVKEWTAGQGWIVIENQGAPLPELDQNSQVFHPGWGRHLYCLSKDSTEGPFWAFSLDTHTRQFLPRPSTFDAWGLLTAGPDRSILFGGGYTQASRYQVTGDGPSGVWVNLALLPIAPMTSFPPLSDRSGSAIVWTTGSDDFYSATGHGSTQVLRYSLVNGRFETALPRTPESIGLGGAAVGINSGNDLYVLRGSSFGFPRTDFYHYSADSKTWSSKASPGYQGKGCSLAWAGGRSLYATLGGNSFRRYDIDTDTWTPLASAGGGSYLMNAGTKLVWAGGDSLYTSIGTNFLRYSIAQDLWTPATSNFSFGAGTSFAWPGFGDRIFALISGTSFTCYSMTDDSWGQATPLAQLPGSPSITESSLISLGDGDRLLAFTLTALCEYSISKNEWRTVAALPGSIGAGAALALTESNPNPYVYAVQGGNQTGFWSYRLNNTLPAAPTSLLQLDSKGRDLARGGSTRFTFSIQATLKDDDNDAVCLQVETKAAGTIFTSPTAAQFAPDGSSYFQGTFGPGGTHSVKIPAGSLPIGDYHWQVRAVDSQGAASPWVAFDSESGVDLRIVDNIAPAPADAAWQSKGSTSDLVKVGGRIFRDEGLTISVEAFDDDLDEVTLEVELRPMGIPFSGQPTLVSARTASGRIATIIAGHTAPGSYHWQYRERDQYGLAGGWTAFGGNGEEEVDIVIFETGSLGSAGCLQSSGRAATLPLLLLLAALFLPNRSVIRR